MRSCLAGRVAAVVVVALVVALVVVVAVVERSFAKRRGVVVPACK